MVGVGGSSPLGRTNKFKQKRRSLSGVFVFKPMKSSCFYFNPIWIQTATVKLTYVEFF